MVDLIPNLQFRSKDMFVVVLVTAVVLGFVAKETLVVAVATIFCCLSWIGLAIAIWFSGAYIFKQLMRARQFRQYRYFLSSLIKWLMVVALILAWLVVTISAANFVSENYVSGGRNLVVVGLLLSPLIAAALLHKFSLKTTVNPAHHVKD